MAEHCSAQATDILRKLSVAPGLTLLNSHLPLARKASATAFYPDSHWNYPLLYFFFFFKSQDHCYYYDLWQGVCLRVEYRTSGLPLFLKVLDR